MRVACNLCFRRVAIRSEKVAVVAWPTLRPGQVCLIGARDPVMSKAKKDRRNEPEKHDGRGTGQDGATPHGPARRASTGCHEAARNAG